MSHEEDEDELQLILDRAPDQPLLRDERCIFCEDVPDRWVAPEDVGLRIPQDVEKGPVAICSDCFRSETSGCMRCIAGNFCSVHDPVQVVNPGEEEELITDEELEQILTSLRRMGGVI